MKPCCNLHTHTLYCDAVNTVDEMVEAAIAAGLKTIGLSSHFLMDIGEPQDWSMNEENLALYRADTLKAKEKYKDRINVLLGCEKDYFSPVPEDEYDYTIGSVHFVCKNGVYVSLDIEPKDLLDAIRELYCGNSIELAKDYYALVADSYRKMGSEIIGHFDLLTKFNDKFKFLDTDNKEYRNAALEAADALLCNKELLFEINTGAMARGWRTEPYPSDFILKYLNEKKARIILTGDSHSAENIVYAYDDAIEYAKACGVKELWTVEKGLEFVPVKI